MRFESFSHPKAKDLSTPADDVVLHIPGRVTAVFDGASDALRRQIRGVPIGRTAAIAVAQETALLPADAASWPVEAILSRLSAAIAEAVSPGTDGGPASTTAMIAFDTPDAMRLVGLGDTGFRVNGGIVENIDLLPDRVSVPARVSLFKLLRQRHSPQDAEELSQFAIGHGLQNAIQSGLIGPGEADEIISHSIETARLSGADDEIAELLSDGLRNQHKFSNRSDKRLGYGILNGREPICGNAIDRVIAKSDLRSLEIFSDGYLVPAKGSTVAEWEATHAALEQEDQHHIQAPQAVKGSTSSHFFDDRTVAILLFDGPAD